MSESLSANQESTPTSKVSESRSSTPTSKVSESPSADQESTPTSKESCCPGCAALSDVVARLENRVESLSQTVRDLEPPLKKQKVQKELKTPPSTHLTTYCCPSTQFTSCCCRSTSTSYTCPYPPFYASLVVFFVVFFVLICYLN